MPGITIGVAQPAAWKEVLSLVYIDEPEARRQQEIVQCLGRLMENQPANTILLEARCDGQLVGAIRGDIQNGGLGVIVGPRVNSQAPGDTHALLLSSLEHQFLAASVSMCQVLIAPSASVRTEWYTAANYLQSADVLYFLSTRDQFPESPPESELVFTPFRSSERSRLASILLATYDGTQDFPVLNGRRPISSVIDGYLSIGVFSPETWWFISHGGQDVGCLLVSQHPEFDLCELVYMGLVPQGRRHNWGAVLVRQAQWAARRYNVGYLFLGVDASNLPAIRTYTRAGFIEFDRRHVFFRFLTDG